MLRRILFVAVLMPLMAISCTVEETTSDVNKIIGSNELTPVAADGSNLPERLRSLPQAIGMLETGCTVTHLGNGLVITAAHCFPEKPRNPDECLAKQFPKMTIQWGYRQDQPAGPSSTCLKLLKHQLDDGYDFALLQVDNPPPAAMDVELNKRPPEGRKITTFGHPRKRPLEWSQYCVLVALPADVMTDVPEKDRKNIFAHQCDTEQGHSGSPLIDVQTLELIGIHHGGLDPWNTATWVPASAVAKAIRTIRSAQNPK